MILRFIILITIYSYSTIIFGYSFIKIRTRCNENNLSPQDAYKRNQWALKCFKHFHEEISYHNNSNPIEYALVSNHEETKWNAPIDSSQDCSIWTKLHAFCVSSCYSSSQKIWFENGYLSIKKALEQRAQSIMVLSASSSLDNFIWQPKRVDSYTKSWRKALEDIVTITFSSHNILQVTLDHPLLFSNGKLLPAKEVKVGSKIMTVEGDVDKVISIKHDRSFRRVYNVSPKSNTIKGNIVSAQGLLVGSARYQYDSLFRKLQYRTVLRNHLNISFILKKRQHE